VSNLDVLARTVTLDGGETLPFGALLLATGANPRRLSIPGAALPHVLTLRSLADSRVLIERTKTAKRAVSRPRGSHPRALAEPYVNVSAHTAPIMQPVT
jgi:NAD(P)H-nitrite reductase large subunit